MIALFFKDISVQHSPIKIIEIKAYVFVNLIFATPEYIKCKIYV